MYGGPLRLGPETSTDTISSGNYRNAVKVRGIMVINGNSNQFESHQNLRKSQKQMPLTLCNRKQSSSDVCYGSFVPTFLSGTIRQVEILPKLWGGNVSRQLASEGNYHGGYITVAVI